MHASLGRSGAPNSLGPHLPSHSAADLPARPLYVPSRKLQWEEEWPDYDPPVRQLRHHSDPSLWAIVMLVSCGGVGRGVVRGATWVRGASGVGGGRWGGICCVRSNNFVMFWGVPVSRISQTLHRHPHAHAPPCDVLY